MTDDTRPPQPYSSGERVFGPPGGTFDADWAATALRSLRPELDHARSVRLTSAAWELLRTRGLRGPELAQALSGAHLEPDDRPGISEPLARDVAAVVTETVELYGA